MAANMDTVATFEMAVALHGHNMFTCIHKHYTAEEWQSFALAHPDVIRNVAVSSGTSEKDFEKLSLIIERVPEIVFVCIDVANGYSEHFVAFVKRVHMKYLNHVIIAGNVVTCEMTEELILNGADIIKVGIGPGSACLTRKKAGVGYPQLSAVIECADAAHGLGGHIISDGGCACPGDISKAFGAGADFVMLGGMLAGHDECGGDIITEELTINGQKSTKKYKEFYGMSSSTAMHKYAGGIANYRSSEGRTLKIPYKGPVNATCNDILGGVRSTCTYVGALTLKELSKRTTFVRVTQQLNTIFTAHDEGKN